MDRNLPQNSGAQLDTSPALIPANLPEAEVPCVKNTGASRILIADDHEIFRDGLRMLLELRAGFRVVGQAEDGEEAIRLVHQLKPDVLLLDLAMPRLSGLDVLRELAKLSAPVRRIVLAAEFESSDLVQAIQFGAQGMVLKHSATHVLFDCIRTVMAGRYWVENQNVSDLVQALRKVLIQPGTKAQPKALGLTARELEVTRTVVAGYTNQEIAQNFSISEHTVKNHLTNIFDKLGVSNRLELALLAIEQRLSDIF